MNLALVFIVEATSQSISVLIQECGMAGLNSFVSIAEGIGVLDCNLTTIIG